MTPLSDVRIFLCTTPVNMSHSFDRLVSLARETFEQDPLSGGRDCHAAIRRQFGREPSVLAGCGIRRSRPTRRLSTVLVF
jgi:hypothetical protein